MESDSNQSTVYADGEVFFDVRPTSELSKRSTDQTATPDRMSSTDVGEHVSEADGDRRDISVDVCPSQSDVSETNAALKSMTGVLKDVVKELQSLKYEQQVGVTRSVNQTPLNPEALPFVQHSSVQSRFRLLAASSAPTNGQVGLNDRNPPCRTASFVSNYNNNQRQAPTSTERPDEGLPSVVDRCFDYVSE